MQVIDDFHHRHADRTSVVRRSTRTGFKAGNLNHALSSIHKQYDFFAVCDADSVLPSQFIQETLPYFEDGSVAFVQTLQRAVPSSRSDTICRTLFRVTDAYWTEVVIRSEACGFLMFHGHGALVRTKAWRDAGGFPEVVSEDLAFSTLVRTLGYRGALNVHSTCLELFPATYEALSRRQRKYVAGACEHLRTHMMEFLTSDLVPRHEKLDRCVAVAVLLMPCWAGVSTLALSITSLTTFQAHSVISSAVVSACCAMLLFLPLVRHLWREPVVLIKCAVAGAVVYLALAFRATFDAARALSTGKASFPVTGATISCRNSTIRDLSVDAVGSLVCVWAIWKAHVYTAIPLLISVAIGNCIELVSRTTRADYVREQPNRAGLDS
jgi:cellulose synthase/poly-beta-1,6-N-acetylglucosamine synthase-like glycosyltransferase